jgi:hypothetical protein
MKTIEKITRIKPPKFRVGRYVLNEYELRRLMVQVAAKKKPSGILVKDAEGRYATITEDGSLSRPLYGLDLISSCNLRLIRIRRENAGMYEHQKTI